MDLLSCEMWGLGVCVLITLKSLTSVSMMSPMRKDTTATARMKSSLRFLRRKVVGYMSTMAVTRLSTHTNWSGEKHQVRVWMLCLRFLNYSDMYNTSMPSLSCLNPLSPDCPVPGRQSWWRRSRPTGGRKASWTQLEGRLWRPDLVLG